MPKSTSAVNLDLEDFLVSKGYDVTPLDSSGKPLPTADQSDILQFHFHREGKDYGTVTISIDGLKNMTVYYDDEIANSGVSEDNMDADRGMNGTSWISLVKQLKKFAQRHQLGFVLKDTGRLRIDMKRRKQTEKELREGAELKREKRAFNQVAKNKGGDWDGAGKKIDNMKKSLRQQDIGKDKSVKEASLDTMRRYFAGDTNARDKTSLSQMRDYFSKMDADKSQMNTVNNNQQSKMAEGSNEGRFAGDIPVNLGGVTITAIQVGDEVAYLGQKAEVVAMSKDRKRARITIEKGMGGVTQDVDTSDLKKMGKGLAEGDGGYGYKSLSTEQIMKLIRSGNWEAMSDIKPGRHMQLRNTRNGKNTTIHVKDSVTENNQMKLDEGYYGNRKMSYSDDTPTVKMVIKHNRQLEETDQRFRHIEKIFLETSDGERFAVPTTKPSRARMFARHIAEGGAYKDDRWSHLAEICEDLDNLGGFIRATRSSDKFNESAQRMIGEAVDKYNELRETAKRLQSGRGYNSYFESYEPAVQNDNDDDLLEVFKHSSVDGRIEKAMPTLNKLGIRRGKLEEADMFEQWADSVIDESLELNNDRQMSALVELLTRDFQVGPNGEIAISELKDIIENDDLNDRLRRAAAVDPNSDARPQIIAWMQEQNNFHYRQVLDQIEVGEEEESEPQPQPEPVPDPQKDGDTTNAKQTDNNPDDLKESDVELSEFKKMLGQV